MKVWDAGSGQVISSLSGSMIRINRVCFSPDGKRLASGGGLIFSDLNIHSPCVIEIWDATTGKQLLTLKGHTQEIYGVCYTPDGTRLASASADKTVRIWDATTGQHLLTIKGHTSGVYGLNFSPDGKHLASASLDKTVKLWDASTGEDEGASDLVFLPRLNGLPARLHWHRAEAADSETKQEWFAAAFHLRQLLAAKEPDAEQLQERLKRCEVKLRQP